MATTKTLTPTNQAITLAAFTEKPDNRTNVTNDDKLADAVNALNSNIASKEWAPANGDDLLTWLLANIPDRAKLPFSFIKKGTTTKVSDVPLGASQEFSGIVEGYGDRIIVTLTMYNGRRRFYRSIWQNSWQGTDWYPVDVKDVRDFTLDSGESQLIVPTSDSSGLMIIKAQGTNIEYTSIRGYAWINQYANGVGSNIYEYNYNSGASISVAVESTGIRITNNSSRSCTFKVLFVHAYS